MKAVVYKGPFEVAVDEVPDPKIEQPLDAIIRVTTANICGSDLHPYEGRAEFDSGMVFGHENMGVVEQVGPGVERIKVGDRVSVPFNCRRIQVPRPSRRSRAGWPSISAARSPRASRSAPASAR